MEQRLDDLEAHLFFLAMDLSLIRDRSIHVKRLAAELRVLVCNFGSNKPLLLDLMDEHGFTHDVEAKIEAELPVAQGFLLIRADGTIDSNVPPQQRVTLRSYIDDVMAIWLLGKPLSYRQLIRTVAEQAGSSHEDKDVDPELELAQRVEVGGLITTAAALATPAQEVLAAGVALLVHLNETAGYEFKYLSLQPGAEEQSS